MWIFPTLVHHADALMLLHGMAGQELHMHLTAPLTCREIFAFDLNDITKWVAVLCVCAH